LAPSPEYSGLIAYYPFSGSAEDAGGYGNHGTNHGATFVADQCGNPNAAANFDRDAPQWIEAANKTVQNAPLFTGLSIAAWIKPADLAWQSLVSKGPVEKSPNTSAPTWGLFDFILASPAGKLELAAGGKQASMSYSTVDSVLASGAWAHVAIAIDAFGGAQFYLNGNAVGTASTTPVRILNWPAFQPLRIGATFQTAGPNHYAGAMDDLRIYERALSAEEVAILYRKYLGDNCAPSLNDLGIESYGLNLEQMTCDNLTSGQQVSAAVTAGVPIGNCAAAGLKTLPGERVRLQFGGAAKSAP
jgi:hypothetical protein